MTMCLIANYEYFQVNLNTVMGFNHELILLATSVFLFGLVGFIESREFLSILINTEIMMLGINFHLITTAII